MTMALNNIRVIDLTTVLSGPMCTMMLGDAGADVIKVEAPGGDPSRGWGPPFWGNESAEFLALNRNKRSIALDLKNPEDHAILLDLCKTADVFIENYRRGVTERLGIDYKRISAVNPRIVYCSISGFGDSGPRRDQAAYDAVMQAFVGIMHMTGMQGGPPVRASISLCDVSAAMYANQAILLALLARAETGKGQLVETSLFEAQIAWMLFRAVGYFATGKAPTGKMGAAAAHLAPYDAYPTADGHMMIAALNDAMFQRLVKCMDRDDLGHDPTYATNKDRVAHRATLDDELKKDFARRSTADWEKRFMAAGIPCSPINSVGDALEDPQTAARDMIMNLEHPSIGPIRVPGIPIKMSETPGSGRLPPPILDQHRAEILAELAK